MIHELRVPLQVLVTAKTLPTGMAPCSRRGICLAWDHNQEFCLWLVCFDETRELVWVPQPEVRLVHNWTLGRR